MRRTLTLFVLVPLVGGGCKDESSDSGISRDVDGCWTDGHQAWVALSEQVWCREACGSELSGGLDECMDRLALLEEDARERMCFDGCSVDPCLTLWDQYFETCSDEDWEAAYLQCHTGNDTPFWDNATYGHTSDMECIRW